MTDRLQSSPPYTRIWKIAEATYCHSWSVTDQVTAHYSKKGAPVQSLLLLLVRLVCGSRFASDWEGCSRSGCNWMDSAERVVSRELPLPPGPCAAFNICMQSRTRDQKAWKPFAMHESVLGKSAPARVIWQPTVPVQHHACPEAQILLMR